MSKTMLELQLELLAFVFGLQLMSEMGKFAIKEIEGYVNECFLKEKGSRTDAKAILSYIEGGIGVGVFEEDALPDIRAFLSFVVNGE